MIYVYAKLVATSGQKEKRREIKKLVENWRTDC